MVSKIVPAATCLTQALALQLLLARRGQRSQLVIGVGKRADGKFHAHAWLRCNNAVILGGGPGLSEFRPILSGGTHL